VTRLRRTARTTGEPSCRAPQPVPCWSTAPVLALWAVVAERLGFDRDEALPLGRAVAGLNAQSKGRRLGVFKPDEEERRGSGSTTSGFGQGPERAGVMRELFGNPFKPVVADPFWLTSDVVALASGIYEDRAFDRMPILADALQDAGCGNEDLLTHCRDTTATHVRGCWVVDLVLGKG